MTTLYILYAAILIAVIGFMVAAWMVGKDDNKRRVTNERTEYLQEAP
jgi:hypothetical protein